MTKHAAFATFVIGRILLLTEIYYILNNDCNYLLKYLNKYVIQYPKRSATRSFHDSWFSNVRVHLTQISLCQEGILLFLLADIFIVFCGTPLLHTHEYIQSVVETFKVKVDATYKEIHQASKKNEPFGEIIPTPWRSPPIL